MSLNSIISVNLATNSLLKSFVYVLLLSMNPIFLVPLTLLVIKIIVFLKSIFSPLALVTNPSSKICKNKFITLGEAFSNSSTNIQVNGSILIESNIAPSSYPT